MSRQNQPKLVLCGLNARFSHTHLAIRCLAAWLSQHVASPPAIELLEATINDPPHQLLGQLYEASAAWYAFSCAIWNITLVRRLSRELKQVCPDCRIIWGGPEVGPQAAAVLAREPAVDFVISGEGERPLQALIERLQTAWQQTDQTTGHIQWADLPSLAWRDAGGRIQVNPPGTMRSGEAWCFPYSDSDLARDRGRILYYESSRGCPFACSYCLSALDRTTRHRPLERVCQEMDQFADAGVHLVKLVDRTFNADPARARAIWTHLIERQRHRGPPISQFHFEVAGDRFDDATVDLLATAPPGLIQFEIGVQSAQPAVLRAVNRTCDLDRLARQVGRLRQAGNIHLHLDLIAGLPGEDLAGFAGSFDWVSRLAPHHLQLGFIKILPGSPMADLAVARKYCWQVEPPYEVLSSDAMNLADLLLLKRVATMLDWFGNSGLYAGSLAWLLPRWSGPFRFYADLADFARGEGALSRALNVSDRSRLLWRFARAQCPDLQGNAGLEQALLDLLRLDYRASGQKGQPAWLQDGSETERTAQVR